MEPYPNASPEGQPTVVHLMRKFLPLTATFIRNQLSYAKAWRPVVAYTEFEASTTRDSVDQIPQDALEGSGGFAYKTFKQLGTAQQKRLAAWIGTQGATVAHCHYGVDALVYAPMLEAIGVPTLVSFYGYDASTFPKRAGGLAKIWLQRAVFSNKAIKIITAMSEDMRSDLIALGCPEEKIRVHYHGVATEFFSAVNAKPGRIENSTAPTKLLIVSGLAAKKGHLFLLEALAKAGQLTKARLHLDIVGEGELRSDIEAAIQRLGLQYSVAMHGRVAYGSDEHRRYLEGSHAFIHPSITGPDGDKEGIPGALVEAMAAGLPVISTYHAGIPSVVKDGEQGWLVEENDIDALARVLVEVAENPRMREERGNNARHHALKHLDIKPRQIALEALYSELAMGLKS